MLGYTPPSNGTTYGSQGQFIAPNNAAPCDAWIEAQIAEATQAAKSNSIPEMIPPRPTVTPKPTKVTTSVTPQKQQTSIAIPPAVIIGTTVLLPTTPTPPTPTVSLPTDPLPPTPTAVDCLSRPGRGGGQVQATQTRTPTTTKSPNAHKYLIIGTIVFILLVVVIVEV